ncbi:MAG: FMN-binding protein [Clostridiaceae bacterium]|jgi:Na+-translocating ferredoxin:NAD+ oxidoreductase RnfG subunit|nr:FMN-binding protein [Clostridiaceae bacterium]
MKTENKPEAEILGFEAEGFVQESEGLASESEAQEAEGLALGAEGTATGSPARKRRTLSADTRGILKIIIVLATIAAVAGLVLGVVHAFTEVDENAAILSKLTDTFPGETFTENTALVFNDASVKDGSVKKVFKSESGAYAYLAAGKGYGGDVQLFILVEHNIITKIAVYKASETPGLGDKVLKQGTMAAQFIGVDISELTAFKLSGGGNPANGEVTGVTGSTFTSNGVVRAVNAAVYCHNKIINREAGQ